MPQARDDDGKFVERTSTDAVFELLKNENEPLTATEIADHLDISNRTALDKLNELNENEPTVIRKQVGANAVIWFIRHGAVHEQAFEDFASRAMEEHGEHIEEIILFGSTARGETRGIDSDVDVFVVVDTMEIKDALGEIAYDVMHKHGVVVAEVVKPKELVENNADHPLVETVRREGRAYA